MNTVRMKLPSLIYIIPGLGDAHSAVEEPQQGLRENATTVTDQGIAPQTADNQEETACVPSTMTSRGETIARSYCR
jgi:hypothetical protein